MIPLKKRILSLYDLYLAICKKIIIPDYVSFETIHFLPKTFFHTVDGISVVCIHFLKSNTLYIF